MPAPLTPGRYSFGRPSTFSGSSAYREHRQNARRLEDRFFTALVAPASTWRLGIVASKARIGGAVLRNRAKRRLRAAFARAAGRATSPAAVVLYAKDTLLRADFADIVAALENVLP